MRGLIPEEYAPFANEVFSGMGSLSAITTPADVAEVVWRAANDESDQLHFPAGADAVALAQSM